jgi:hypothetical protein
MAGSITAYVVRHPGLNTIAKPGEPSSVGYRHNNEGLSAARRMAAEHSAGRRELVITELVDGNEKRRVGHFWDGREV